MTINTDDETLTSIQMAEAMGVPYSEYRKWISAGSTLSDRLPHTNARWAVELWLECEMLEDVRKGYQEYLNEQAQICDHEGNPLYPNLAAKPGPRTPVADRILDLGDTLPQRDPDLVQGWLPSKGITVMYGPSGAGKSFLALDMAMSIHNGTASILGETTEADVTYILGEGVAGLGERVGAWQTLHAAGRADIPQFVNGLDLGDNNDLAELTAAISQGSLLVIDTLSRCTPGVDENSTKDMSRIVSNLDRIREAKGITVLVIHHSGKDASRGARGSTVLVGAVDAEIRVTGDVDQAIAVTNTKRRDGKEEETIHLSARDVGESIVLDRSDAPTTEPVQVETVLDALVNGMTSIEWEGASGLSSPTFRKNRKWLVAGGDVRVRGKGRGARYSKAKNG